MHRLLEKPVSVPEKTVYVVFKNRTIDNYGQRTVATFVDANDAIAHYELLLGVARSDPFVKKWIKENTYEIEAKQNETTEPFYRKTIFRDTVSRGVHRVEVEIKEFHMQKTY